MPVASATVASDRTAKQRGGAATAGLAQLSLIEHAVCPLDTQVSLRDGFRYNTGFYYGPSGSRRFANVKLTAAHGLSPGDEFFLWGLLALTLADRDGGIEFWATPHYCLRRLGCIGDATKKGRGNYELFRHAIGRLAAVTYTSDAFFDPVRSEHRQVAFGFLSYSLPLDPASSRAWRIVWDPLFLEFCRATGGGRLFFDLDLYRDLDFASRRMFLMLHKLFGGSRHRVSLTTDARHLAVNVLGFAGHLPAKISHPFDSGTPGPSDVSTSTVSPSSLPQFPALVQTHLRKNSMMKLGTNWGQGWQGKANLLTIQKTRQFFVSNTLEGTCSTLPTQRQSRTNRVK